MGHEVVVLASPEHPLFSRLQICDLTFFDAGEDISQLRQHLETRGPALVAELTLHDLEDKCDWIAALTENLSLPVLCEAGHLCAEKLLDRVPPSVQLVGLAASAFYSPTAQVELFLADDDFRPEVEKLFTALELTPHFVPRPRLAFTYPRTISMLINEAHLALGDGLASAKALDTAMKFGVNYPLGPIEWGERIGHALIAKLLDALRTATGDERYQVAPSLKIK